MNRRTFLVNGLKTSTAAATLIMPFARAKAAASSAIVETSSGKIRGTVSSNKPGRVFSFKGVPYGASTEGARRFLPPVVPGPWTGVKDTLELGPRSPQPVRILIPEMGDALTGHGPMSEDCLTLNVWTAGLKRGKRPVMVWFHGGGFRTGWSGSVMYDGTELARKHDVVVVGVNHRLNVFGNLYLAGLSGSPDERLAQSSNLGMLDLLLALEWVRDNIAAFGGDAANVTIFGQSGGGGKVSTLQAMPKAKGLFHRMIVQSTISDTGLWGLQQEEAMRTTETFLARLGLKANQLGKLQTLPVEQLLRAMNGGTGSAETKRDGSAQYAGSDLSLRLVPVVDGVTLLANPFDPVAPEISANIPLMVGSVETEAVPYTAPNDPYWTVDDLDDAALLHQVEKTLQCPEADARRVVAVFQHDPRCKTNADIAIILASDAGSLRTAGHTIALSKAAQNRAPVYAYYFNWHSPLRQGRVRAMHCMELPFVFDHVDAVTWMTGIGPDRQSLADKVSAAWVAFARTGNPNHQGLLPQWDPFTKESRETMILGGECKAVNDPYRAARLAIGAARG